MKRLRRLAAAVLLAVCCTAPAAARGPQGHRTVGAIADRLLTAQAQAAVLRLLADDRDKFGNPSGRSTLESVAVWADEIRGTPADRPRWHYQDMPVCGSEPQTRYCPDGQCITVQLLRLTQVLGDPRAGASERAEALKWVVHLVGDIHQPLHVADNADHGGNLVPVALAGVRSRGRENLHRAWDNDLVRLALHSHSRQQPPADIDALAQRAQRLLASAGQGTAAGWAAESNNLARNVAYTYAGFACNRVPQDTVLLDSRYLREAQDIVRLRLLLAGARLATLLNLTLRATTAGGAP